MIDMSNNRVPYRLLTAEEKAALHEHEKAGGEFEFTYSEIWMRVSEPTWGSHSSYRTLPLPKTQDVIAWDRLPDWVEWVMRKESGHVWGYDEDRWSNFSGRNIRIDDWPGIVQIGTVDWRDSRQRRPRG
jgi:hypothetical protein